MKELGECLRCAVNHVKPGSKLSRLYYKKANAFSARQASSWSRLSRWLTGLGQHPIIQNLAYNSTVPFVVSLRMKQSHEEESKLTCSYFTAGGEVW